MEIKAQHQYAQSVDTVFSSFSDPKHLVKKHEELGARNVEVQQCDREADAAKVTISYETQPSDNVPGPLKSFAKDWAPLTQKESWTKDGDQWKCEFAVELDGVPVIIEGTMLLRPEGDGSVNEVHQTITCGIPFLGNMVEEFISKDAEEQTEAEYQYIKAYLDSL